MSYPIIICEDNPVQLKQVEKTITNYLLFHEGNFDIKLATQSPDDVIYYLSKNKVSNGIFLLDIDLNHTVNGIELAVQIRQSCVDAKIIFITTHDELMPLTLQRKVEPLGFIAKDQALDVFRDEILELLISAKERNDKANTDKNQSFNFSIANQTFSINKDEILSIETSAIPHKIVLYTIDEQHEFYDKLSEISAKHPELFKISRSCLINLDNIETVNHHDREITFTNGMTRYYSIGKSKKLKNAMKR